MEVEHAARALAKGLTSKSFEIAFPWRLAYILKIMRLLPYPLYFQFTKGMVKNQDYGR
jgi:hypothetical protein